LFVSHNLSSILDLCSKSILLENGNIKTIDTSQNVITQYLNLNKSGKAECYFSNGSKKASFTFAKILDCKGEIRTSFSLGERLVFQFGMTFRAPNESSVKTAIELYRSDGLKISQMIDVDSGFQIKKEDVENRRVEVILDDIRLYPGEYAVSLYCGDMSSVESYDYQEQVLSFEVIDGGKLISRRLIKESWAFYMTPKWELK
jgi:lipopolysaccharide transport system ATP-binding protein